MATIHFQDIPEILCPDCGKALLICGVMKHSNILTGEPETYVWANYCDPCNVVVTSPCEDEIGGFLWKLQNNRTVMMEHTDWLL